MQEIKNNTQPECETADAPQEAVDILGAKTGVLSNALKLMNGKYGGAFYVRYICDTGSGCGWLQLIIEYPTGTVQTKLLCKNVCKVSSYEEDGLGEVEDVSNIRHRSGGKILYTPYLTNSVSRGSYNILRKYERPNMPIPTRVLWQRIVDNYANIPVVELTVKNSLQDVYETLLEYGEDLLQQDVRRLGNGYILLTKTEVEEIATDMGFSLQEIRAEFALRGLWVVDKNSGSYQKTKKIDKKNCRFYALKTEPPGDQVIECKVADNVDYAEIDTPPEENAEMEKLKGELAKMKKERDEMVQIVCQRVPDLTQEEIFTKLL